MLDSRSAVASAQRAREQAERAEAPLHQTTPDRARELCRIAQAHKDHEARITAALRTGWLTSGEIEAHLDSLQPHARLSAIRAAGLVLADRWVKVCTATGSMRRVKIYRLPGDTP